MEIRRVALIRSRTIVSTATRFTHCMKSHLQSGIKSLPWRRWIVLVPLCLLNLTVPPASAQTKAVLSPSDIESAYLYNFGKFIEWPAADSAPTQFSICIVGKDEFGSALDSIIQNDTVKGHAIVVRRLPAIAGADSCQILFLASSEKLRLAKDLDALKDKSILTVSSLPGFIAQGGMIQFIVQDNRVRFAVNLAAANRVHLGLSSELLKVAVYVNSSPLQEGQ